jgi:hypothetical protein
MLLAVSAVLCSCVSSAPSKFDKCEPDERGRRVCGSDDSDGDVVLECSADHAPPVWVVVEACKEGQMCSSAEKACR